MTKPNKQNIWVYADWMQLKRPTVMGTLQATWLRGKETFSFIYDDAWLQSSARQWLDPSLQLYSGPQYAAEAMNNFGLFLDSSPDRWGRTLMNRREAIIARAEGHKSKSLSESDYLLGVHDGHRMGALRFKREPSGNYLDDNHTMAAPPWTSIRALEEASLKLEQDDINEEEKIKWLNMLMAPGSSLGGARPKASISENDKALDLALAHSVAPYFRISASRAKQITEETIRAVATWRTHAQQIGISKSEQAQMAAAFRVD
jgi:serine/threonine-protein kinase HipA